MKSFIVMSFALLWLAFFQLSGGADFEPRAWRPAPAGAEIASAKPATAPRETPQDEVTRASLDLVSLADIQRDARQETLPTVDPDPQPAAAIAENPDTAQPSILDISLQRPVPGASLDRQRDVRVVTGDLVNVRLGPSTLYNVVTRLAKGDSVIVLEDSGAGWVRMQAQATGEEGWIADYLLSPR